MEADSSSTATELERAAQRCLELQGRRFGPSRWVSVTHAAQSAFAEATQNLDPLHLDDEWAAAHTHYAGAIAYGYWTLSMIPSLLREIVGASGTDTEPLPGIAVNYGLDRLRFLAPVVVGSQIRLAAQVTQVSRVAPDRVRIVFDCTIEIRGEETPALVTDQISLRLLSRAESTTVEQTS